MNQPDSTKIETDDVSVKVAEAQVNASLSRFENAMEDLADKVEGTTQKIQGVVNLASLPKQEFIAFKNRAQEVINPVVARVRQNPQPYVMAAASVVIGYFLISFFSRRRVQIKASDPYRRNLSPDDYEYSGAL